MTKDIQRAILRACARFIAGRLEPLEKRLTAMETKAIEVDVGEVSAAFMKDLLGSEGLSTLIDLQVAAAVSKHFEANPVRHGIDGKPGERGEPGQKGDPGADGIGLAGAMIDRDGNLIVTKTNGEPVPLGPVIGKDGRDGADGLGFEDLDVEYDGERTFTLKWHRGDVVKTKSFHVPTVIDRGYWREGTEAKAGDAMTHDGTLWIALRDTKAKPSRESEDWRIGARKGRDGLQGPPGKDYKPPEPVRLNQSEPPFRSVP